MTDLHEWATYYASRGWPVLPLIPNDKRPLTKHGLKDASTDLEQIAEWWSREPNANVGLRTGIAFDVLDIDGPEGIDELNRLFDLHGYSDPGPVSVTGKGGRHFLYAPTGHGNRARLYPSIDYRGEGGYIVAPPSIHPNGTTYEWLDALIYEWPDMPEGCDGFGPERGLVTTPLWLAEALAPPKVTSPVSSITPVRTERGKAALREGVLDVVRQAVTGERNHRLNWAAYTLGQHVANGTLDLSDVDALVDVGLRVGLSEREVQGTVDSGLRSGWRDARGIAS